MKIMCTANGSMYVPTMKNLLEYVVVVLYISTMQVKELINMRDRCMNGIFKGGSVMISVQIDFSVFIMVLNVPSYFE